MMSTVFSGAKARATVWLVMTVWPLVCAVIALAGASRALGAVASIDLSNPRVQFSRDLDEEDVEDLRVKVIGGFVSVNRSRKGPGWTFNAALANLTTDLAPTAPANSRPGKVSRGGVDYTYEEGSNPWRYTREDQGKFIVKTAGGWRWEDSDGSWIEYDESLSALVYGNRNGPVASVQRDASGRITGFRDRLGQQILTYDYVNGRIATATDYTGRQVLYGYTQALLTTVTDVRGNVWTDEYAGDLGCDPTTQTCRNTLLIKRTDPEQRVTSFLRDSAGLLAGIKDADGFGVDYRYDYDATVEQFYIQERFSGNRIVESWFHARNGLIRRDLNGRTLLNLRRDSRAVIVTDENSNDMRADLDVQGRVTGVTYPDGSRVPIDFARGLNVPASVTDGNGVVTRFEHDAQGNVVRIIEAAGRPEERITLRRFDAYGQLIESRQVVDGGSADRVTTLTRDNYGNIATVTDPEGNAYAMEYDAIGNLSKVTDPRNKVWQFVYDAAGNVLEAKDPLNGTVQYQYDRVGNLVRLTDQANAVTQYVYNRQNNVVRTIDALQSEWTYEYSEAGLLKRSLDPDGHAREYAYDRDGRLTSYKDGTGNTTTLAYFAGHTQNNPSNGPLVRITYPTFVRERLFDTRNRMVAETDIETSGRRRTTRWTYDAGGRVTSVTTPDLRTKEYAYDPLGRLVRQTQTDHQNVVVAWDSWGQTREVTDPRQLTTILRYDKLDRLVSEQQPNGALTRYAYDPASNLLSVVDPRNQEVRFEYDDLGRPGYQRTYPVAGVNPPSRTIQYTYDPRGLLTAYVDGTVSGTFTPDPLGRVTAAAVNFGPFSAGVQYGYNRNGSLQTYTAPDGVTYGYTYDGNEQLQTVAIPQEGAIAVTARRWLAPSSISLPGGGVRQYQYDDRLQPLRITSTDGGGNVVLDYQYTRDDADQVRDLATEHGTYHYTYDDAYRLTAADHPLLGLESYTYDAAGNRFPADPALASQWTYGNNNELRATDTASYEYDAAGNQSRRVGSGGETRFGYDERSRLTSVESGSGSLIAQYAYDPFGRRLWKDVGGNRTYFYYTPEGLAAELDASGNVIRSYGYEPGTSWTRAPLFMHGADGYAYYQNDHLGTPRKLTTKTGAVVWSAVYPSFGAAQPQVETAVNPLRFPGQYFDAETGLHQNYFRDYDALTGRYVEEDPISLAGGLNRYAYAGANPLNLVDDHGQFFEIIRVIFDIYGAVKDAYDCGKGLGNLFGNPCATRLDALSTGWTCFNAVTGAKGALESIGKLRKPVPPTLGVVEGGAQTEKAAGSTALVPYYPPNRGFSGAPGDATLVPGSIVDRYGGPGGSFLSPQGTPPWARSLPYGAETRPLNAYEVVKPIDVQAGKAAPWFNQPGGGTQYDLGQKTVQDLIDGGYLKPIKR
jgi:RHS repeat-associated protein